MTPLTTLALGQRGAGGVAWGDEPWTSERVSGATA